MLKSLKTEGLITSKPYDPDYFILLSSAQMYVNFLLAVPEKRKKKSKISMLNQAAVCNAML